MVLCSFTFSYFIMFVLFVECLCFCHCYSTKVNRLNARFFCLLLFTDRFTFYFFSFGANLNVQICMKIQSKAVLNRAHPCRTQVKQLNQFNLINNAFGKTNEWPIKKISAGINGVSRLMKVD